MPWLGANVGGAGISSDNAPSVLFPRAFAAGEAPDWYTNSAAGQAPLTWRLTVLRQASTTTDCAGNTVSYVIHRLCPVANCAPNATCAGVTNVCGQTLSSTAVKRRGRRPERAELLHYAARHALPRHGALDRPARFDRLRPNNAAQPMTALRENSMSFKKSLAKRLVLYGVLGCMRQTALAAVTDISSIPLATSAARTSCRTCCSTSTTRAAAWDFMPITSAPTRPVGADPVQACMVDSSGQPYARALLVRRQRLCVQRRWRVRLPSGGANGFNGVAYDPILLSPGLGPRPAAHHPPTGLPLATR